MSDTCASCGTDHDGYPPGSLGADTRCLRAQAEEIGHEGIVAQAGRLESKLKSRRNAVIGDYLKPCLRCGLSLDDAPLTERLTITCPCGVVYSAEMVEQADPDTWMRVFAEDGYEIHDDGSETLTVKAVSG